MKAIMISGKPKWTALIMNGDKNDEIRKNKALANAVQKLIDKYGYAEIYWYCSKDKSLIYTDGTDGKGDYVDWQYYESYKGDKNDIGSGKVVFKFRCYNVEEITPFEEYESPLGMAYKLTADKIRRCSRAQLTYDEYNHYLKGKNGYDIHISDLEIFDRPRELSEFVSTKQQLVCEPRQTQPIFQNVPLSKAPQNFCYVEVQ